MTVTAVLVSHDGSRWLPTVLDALAAQTRLPDALWAVDTGSTDDSVALLEQALGADRVLTAPATTPYARAVEQALASADPAADRDADEETDDWIWLLHDDCAPAPDALDRLLAVAQRRPEAALIGPKLREWPSLRTLLEVGVSLTGTARRETGLERGEYDQGQHDRVRQVLAVNTAGLLVRRSVLEEIGLDPDLPVIGTDVDLGWRAARAGLVTLVAPEAVAFHAEASRRGRRTGPLVRHPRREERASSMRILLAQAPAALLPLRMLRLALGALLRVLGLLLVRAPGEAWDEVCAAVDALGHPGRLLRARRRARRTRRVGADVVRPLLPPATLPYRRGIDGVTDVARTVVDAGRDALAQRAQQPRWFWSLAAAAALVGGALVASRALIGPGDLRGGALLPAPDGVAAWWSLAATEPTGAWVIPLAAAATVLGGSPPLTVAALLVLVVPLATFGSLRFFEQLVGRGTAWWASLCVGAAVAASGVLGSGQLGPLVGIALMPFLARSALGMLPFAAPEERRRAWWRVTGWLALVTAFAPSAWLLAVAVALVAVVRGGLRGAWRAVAPVLIPVAAVPLLLAPWWVPRIGEPGLLLLDAGLPSPAYAGGVLEVLGARTAEGAPAWWALGVVVAAAAALLRADTRAYVAWAWAVAGAALGLAAVLARVEVVVPGTGDLVAVSPAFALLVAHVALVAAAALGADGARRRLVGASFGWRQPLLAAVGVAALLTPALGLGWWVAGNTTGALEREATDAVPTYMTQLAQARPGYAVLVLDATASGAAADFTEVVWSVRAGGRPTLGTEAVAALQPVDGVLQEAVGSLVTTSDAEAVATLARRGVGFVFALPPAPRDVVAALDATSGLSPASAPQPRAGAWQLTEAGSGQEPGRSYPAQPWLFGVALAGGLVVAVLAAPGRREVTS